MSKAEYTLLVSIIGFYALLFAYLIKRALTGMIRTWWPVAPKSNRVSRPRTVARNRAWTRAVWREHLAPEMERSKQSATLTA
ncbi:MAG TPA: hypothetical protein VIW80_16035 [Pyrinomonadaceae bacterium]